MKRLKPFPGKINHQVNTQNSNNSDLEVMYTNRKDKLVCSPVDQCQFSHRIEHKKTNGQSYNLQKGKEPDVHKKKKHTTKTKERMNY